MGRSLGTEKVAKDRVLTSRFSGGKKKEGWGWGCGVWYVKFDKRKKKVEGNIVNLIYHVSGTFHELRCLIFFIKFIIIISLSSFSWQFRKYK